MNLERVAGIAQAVLYEGYILYPYRASAIKNRQRWTFGGVFPRAYAEAEGSEPWQMQTQCLLRGGPSTRAEARVRFLHPLQRDVYRLGEPRAELPDVHKADGGKVAMLEVDGTRFLPGEEAIEREIVVPERPIAELVGRAVSIPLAIAGIGEREPIIKDGLVIGFLVRTGSAVSGSIALTAEEVAAEAYRLTVRIENSTPVPAGERRRETARRLSFASTHTILGVSGGAFISLIDPPADLRAAAADCDNQGTWPVLVGGEGESDTMLSSPIILYDDPQIAPESPGDFFDSTEIDEILTLRILTMTDAEKQEMAATDIRARALLERAEALTAAEFGRLHGAFRRTHWQAEAERAPGDAKPRLASLVADGRRFKVGAHVRLHPKRRADIMDIVLTDQEAVIEAIEHDFEDRMHVAVTLVDDPGRDFGLDRYPGHRFFFAQDEIELLDPENPR